MLLQQPLRQRIAQLASPLLALLEGDQTVLPVCPEHLIEGPASLLYKLPTPRLKFFHSDSRHGRSSVIEVPLDFVRHIPYRPSLADNDGYAPTLDFRLAVSMISTPSPGYARREASGRIPRSSGRSVQRRKVIHVAHSISAKKRIRQNLKARARNRGRKTAVRNEIKSFLSAVSGGDLAKAESQLRKVSSGLDRIAAKRTIHKNAAARKRSRLTRKLNAAKAAAGKGTPAATA